MGLCPITQNFLVDKDSKKSYIDFVRRNFAQTGNAYAGHKFTGSYNFRGFSEKERPQVIKSEIIKINSYL